MINFLIDFIMIRTIYTIEEQLDKLQDQSFNYFMYETNPLNGLVSDRSTPDWPAGIAVTGIALTNYPVAVERGLIDRDQAVERVLNALRFFWSSRNGSEPEATGYQGFYYRFLDKQKGRRAKLSELSTRDTAILIAGALTAAGYFIRDSEKEKEIRDLADALYQRVNWQWALDREFSVIHGWKPETGILNYRWKGYDEGLLILILGLGSNTFPLPEESYSKWTSTYKWINSYGFDYLYAGPLLTHQMAHTWIDFRGIQDEYMRDKGIDYFENSSRATRVQQLYAADNPRKFVGYNEKCWGISYSDGPGPETKYVKGKIREFFSILSRGVPFGPDDGTISPWASIASLPFAPEIVLPTIDYLLHETDLNICSSYGFKSAFNPTYSQKPHNPHGWRSPWHLGITQGHSLSMIENYRTGFVWNIMKENPHIIRGLRRAGFKDGWLKMRVSEKEKNSREGYIKHSLIRGRESR
jgi:hypothetical protein